MADPLGATASIVTLLDVCVKVIAFIRQVRDGSSERTRLMMEIISTLHRKPGRKPSDP
jgi:hypothetical protein